MSVAVEVIKLKWWKATIIFILVSVFPVIIFNSFIMLYKEIATHALTYMFLKADSVNNLSLVVNISGMGGWLLARLRIPEAFSVYVTCLYVRFILRVFRGI